MFAAAHQRFRRATLVRQARTALSIFRPFLVYPFAWIIVHSRRDISLPVSPFFERFVVSRPARDVLSRRDLFVCSSACFGGVFGGGLFVGGFFFDAHVVVQGPLTALSGLFNRTVFFAGRRWSFGRGGGCAGSAGRCLPFLFSYNRVAGIPEPFTSVKRSSFM